jgi:hypothetical protein
VRLDHASVARTSLPVAHRTCLETAIRRLSSRAIKETTYKEYLATLRALGLEDVPFISVTVANLTTRLQRVLSPNTRRKHAIDLRACLGFPVPCPRPTRKHYDPPSLDVLKETIEASSYRMWGYAMSLPVSGLEKPARTSLLEGTSA